MIRIGALARWCLLAALPVMGCSSGDETTGGGDPRQMPGPQGDHPLEASPPEEAYRAMLRSYEQVAVGKEIGVNLFVAALQKELTARGIDPRTVASINAERIGGPMPGGTVANGSAKPQRATSSVRKALGRVALAAFDVSRASEYFECPLFVEEDNVDTECDRLVTAVVESVLGELRNMDTAVADTIRAQFGCLAEKAQEVITEMRRHAEISGAEAAAIYFEYELRASRQCDDKTNANAVAYRLGLEQGWSLANAALEGGMAVVNACSTDLEGILEGMRSRARGNVDTFIEQHRLCQNADLSRANPKLVQVETTRRQGIMAGIDQRIEILRFDIAAAIAAVWAPGGRCAPPPPPPVAGGGGWGGGDPLILDLDGDGLALATPPRATFDLLGRGQPQQVRWIGARDALLVIDRDGDGRVGSVLELFGDVGRCGAGRCRDGFAALGELDREENGGNGDGVLDARDQSFGRLRLWLDAQGDGLTQAGELHALADHGIAELPLTGAFAAEGMAQGLVTSRAEVTTGRGRRPLVDAWLRIEATAH